MIPVIRQTYDLIFDAVGKTSAASSKSALKPSGVFVTVRSTTSEQIDNLNTLRDVVELGAVRPVIDRCFLLAQTAAAHRYVETGRKQGNVAIGVAPEPAAEHASTPDA